MNQDRLRAVLEAVRSGTQTIDDALARLRTLPFEDLGFAKIDHHRTIRCGFPEVILCQGKTIEQVLTIFERCRHAGGNVLCTRVDEPTGRALRELDHRTEYHGAARTVTLRQQSANRSSGTIVIVAAGTSDLPVAEEARITAEIMDQRTESYHDVGVAGLHRLLAHSESLQSANVAVVVAGMEGALPSVVGGLVSCPVIAVPTSTGYGASFHGLAALLGMLNSCASGVTVVNIDNGFGAGYAAALMNRLADKNRNRPRGAMRDSDPPER